MSSEPTRTVHLHHLLTVNEVAELLGMSPRWVYDAVKDHRIPHIHAGRSIRISPVALLEWLDTQHDCL